MTLCRCSEGSGAPRQDARGIHSAGAQPLQPQPLQPQPLRPALQGFADHTRLSLPDTNDIPPRTMPISGFSPPPQSGVLLLPSPHVHTAPCSHQCFSCFLCTHHSYQPCSERVSGTAHSYQPCSERVSRTTLEFSAPGVALASASSSDSANILATCLLVMRGTPKSTARRRMA